MKTRALLLVKGDPKFGVLSLLSNSCGPG